MLHGSIVASFSIGCYKASGKFPLDNVKPKREALEELIGAQALSADLKPALVAALTGTGIAAVDGR